jgi:phospholipase C
VLVKLRNEGRDQVTFKVKSNAYRDEQEIVCVRGGDSEHRSWSLQRSGNWYDFTVSAGADGGFSRRFAGRVENGRDSFSDPAMGGPATGDQD